MSIYYKISFKISKNQKKPLSWAAEIMPDAMPIVNLFLEKLNCTSFQFVVLI